MSAIPRKNGVGTRCAAIVNHYAIVNLLCRANSLRRSIFSTAGSFGLGRVLGKGPQKGSEKGVYCGFYAGRGSEKVV